MFSLFAKSNFLVILWCCQGNSRRPKTVTTGWIFVFQILTAFLDESLSLFQVQTVRQEVKFGSVDHPINLTFSSEALSTTKIDLRLSSPLPTLRIHTRLGSFCSQSHFQIKFVHQTGLCAPQKSNHIISFASSIRDIPNNTTHHAPPSLLCLIHCSTPGLPSGNSSLPGKPKI